MSSSTTGRQAYPALPRTTGWLGTAAIAMEGSNGTAFPIGVLIAGPACEPMSGDSGRAEPDLGMDGGAGLDGADPDVA